MIVPARRSTHAWSPVGVGRGTDVHTLSQTIRIARARLALLLALLVIVYAVLWFTRPFSPDGVRDWIEPLGAVAPLAFLAISVGLGLALVPGPVLAGAAGLLFGAGIGTLLSVGAAVITGVVAMLCARWLGRSAVESFDARWIAVTGAALERHGLWAVVAQRLIPGVPDAPCSYAAGLLRVRVIDIALGTAIGAAPRAFGYSAIGDSFDEPGSSLSLIGAAVVVGTALAGAYVARRLLVEARRVSAGSGGTPTTSHSGSRAER
jgi:uncharacterized membrane protein YdjX (TVP38/TMEM64 family)